jgi:ADP-ribosylglycohydrolase
MKGTLSMTTTTTDRERARGALWGLFIGDALSMPVHWYYNRQSLERDYGHVADYLEPKNPHPDSILWRSRFDRLPSGFDILHDQARFWGMQGIHYHQHLKAGENTLNLKICRLLMASLSERGAYDPDDFLRRYIHFMTTPGCHSDTYVEECHRHFFSRLAAGIPPRRCGIPEKHIGGLVGMIPLLVYYRHHPSTAASAAQRHRSLTHAGPLMESAADGLITVLLSVLAGSPLRKVLDEEISGQRNPFLSRPYHRWLRDRDDRVIGERLSSACYVEDAVPAVMYLALKYAEDPEEGLVANTRLGGDNAHRGAILGSILGAANGIQAFPRRWIDGLLEPVPDCF